MENLKNKFNQAFIPGISENLSNDEQLVIIDNVRYKYFNDLIDVYIPLDTCPNILTCKRVPLPLWGVNPRSILVKIDENWWNRIRLKVYESQGFHCACCGIHQKDQIGWVKNQLDAHELYDINYQTGEMRLKAIVPLCKACHAGIHFGRLTAKYESGEIQPKTYYQTISYCNTVLAKAGLPLKNWDATVQDNIYSVPWNQWHLTLVIEGKEQKFYSLYKDQKDLEAHY